MLHFRFLLLLWSTAALLVGGCQREERVLPVEKPAAVQKEAARPAAGTAAQTAVAELRPTEGNRATGRATFTRTAEGVEVVVEMQGLSPGRHGIHVHEKGDCSAPDGSSAGQHFATDGTPHGGPDNPPAQRHAGDLGNIEADAGGNATYRRIDPVLQLEGPQAIAGRALLVHADPDDLTSQPAGASGARIACGVIENR